jgi:arginine:pyruvate transaminase
MDVANERMRAGRTRYSNGRGEPEVLNAIAAYYTRRSSHHVAPTQCCFLPGTQTALFASLTALRGRRRGSSPDP